MEIELYSKLQNPIEACEKVGKWLVKSGIIKSQREETGQSAMIIAMSEGKSIVDVIRTYHFMDDGSFTKKALAALAEFRAKGGKHKWLRSGDEPASTDAERYAELELTDREAVKVTYRYSMADAKAEGLVREKSRWVKRPGNMLRARCISNGLGMLCPEIFAGEDEGDEAPERTPEPLLKPQPQTANATPKPDNVIDVPASVVTPPAPEAKQDGPAPKTEEPKKYTEADITISPGTGGLTVTALAALESVIGEANLAKAIMWLKTKGWITEGLSTLSEERAKRIMRKPEQFLGEVLK